MKTPRYLCALIIAAAGLLCGAAQEARAQSVACSSATANIMCLYNQTTQTVNVTFDPTGSPPSAGLFFGLTGASGVFGQMQNPFLGGGGMAGSVLDMDNATGQVNDPMNLVRLGVPAVGGANPSVGFLLQQFTFGGPLNFSFTFGGTITPCNGVGCTPDAFTFQVLDLIDPSIIYADAFQELQASAIPEPGTLLLVGLSGLGVFGAAWRRRRGDNALDPSPTA